MQYKHVYVPIKLCLFNTATLLTTYYLKAGDDRNI